MAEYVPGRFDCLITDVSMPGHSGLDLLQQLRSLGSSMPVIIVTADTESDDPISRHERWGLCIPDQAGKQRRTLSSSAVRPEARGL